MTQLEEGKQLNRPDSPADWGDAFIEGWLKQHLPLVYRLVMWHANYMSNRENGNMTLTWITFALLMAFFSYTLFF